MAERWREEREDEQTLVGREEDKSTSRYRWVDNKH